MLDYATKYVVFPSAPVKPVSLSLKPIVLYCCKTKNQEYVLLSASEVDLEQALNEISIVRDYPEVFPEDIPKFPPKKEIEFSIELIPGTGWISVAPYRMSPLELTELKTQLEELLEKKFVRPSASP